MSYTIIKSDLDGKEMLPMDIIYNGKDKTTIGLDGVVNVVVRFCGA